MEIVDAETFSTLKTEGGKERKREKDQNTLMNRIWDQKIILIIETQKIESSTSGETSVIVYLTLMLLQKEQSFAKNN